MTVPLKRRDGIMPSNLIFHNIHLSIQISLDRKICALNRKRYIRPQNDYKWKQKQVRIQTCPCFLKIKYRKLFL